MSTCCAPCGPSYPICLNQDAGFYLPLFWKDADGEIINLTGYTAKMQVRSSPTASTVILELNMSNGRIVINAAAGLINLIVQASVTELLPAPFVGVYDLFVTAPDGFVNKILTGPFTINKAITQ